MFAITLEFIVVYKDENRTYSFLFQKRNYVVPALPPIGTHILFNNEEGVSVVSNITLEDGNYKIGLDLVELGITDFSTKEEMAKHFGSKGWMLV